MQIYLTSNTLINELDIFCEVCMLLWVRNVKNRTIKGHESLGHCNAIPSLRRRVIYKYIVKYINFKSKLSRFFKYFNIDIFLY